MTRPISGSAVTGRRQACDRPERSYGSISKEVAMRPIRTIAPVALGLVALAVAGCQRPSDPTTAAAPTPTRVEQVAPTTTPTHPATPQARPPTSPAPKPAPDPRPKTTVGLWPVKTLAQARELQDSVDAGHQPWLLAPEQVSIAYATAELDLFGPLAEQVGPAAYQVRSHNGEWEATLYLAQPVRHTNGVWVVTWVGDPVSQ
jgi:hypothetical protein